MKDEPYPYDNHQHIVSRRPALDGVRGVAMLIILYFHSVFYAPKWELYGGFFSVNVFFVLSGCLITYLLVVEFQRTSALRLRDFYRRRVLRLAPAFIILLITVQIINQYEPLRTDQPLWQSMVAAALYVANWFQIFHQGPTTYLDHTWSLSMEEQFYLIWPWVLLLMLRRGLAPRRVAGWAGVGVLTVLALRWTWFVERPFHGEWGYKVLYNNSIAQSDSLMIGIAVGCLAADPVARQWFKDAGDRLADRPWLRAVFVEAAPWIATGYLVMFFRRMTDVGADTYRWGLTGAALFSGVIVLHCMLVDRSSYIWVFSWRPFVYIGQISYGIYLFHVPVAALVIFHTNFSVLERLLLILAISVTAATISFQLIEKRTIAYGQRLRAAGSPAPRPVEIDSKLIAVAPPDLAA